MPMKGHRYLPSVVSNVCRDQEDVTQRSCHVRADTEYVPQIRLRATSARLLGVLLKALEASQLLRMRPRAEHCSLRAAGTSVCTKAGDALWQNMTLPADLHCKLLGRRLPSASGSSPSAVAAASRGCAAGNSNGHPTRRRPLQSGPSRASTAARRAVLRPPPSAAELLPLPGQQSSDDGCSPRSPLLAGHT